MKSATILPVRVERQLREEMEKTVRGKVARRRERAEFVRRGLAAIKRTVEADDGVPAEAVIAKLRATAAAARKKRTQAA
jgi:hypothetical protein